jgi:hypothetical protein
LSGVAAVPLLIIVSPDDRTRHTNTRFTNGVNPNKKTDTDENEK